MATNYYVSSTAWAAVTPWAAGATVALGVYRRQLATPAVGNERVFKCTTAGTTGGTEPSWSLGDNATTTDNTAHWTQVGGHESEQSAGVWNAPLASIFAVQSNISGGGSIAVNVFCTDDHVETWGSSIDCSGTYISVHLSGSSLPPVQADYSKGATLTTNVNNAQIGYADVQMYGFIFNSQGNFQLPQGNTADCLLEDCDFNQTRNAGTRNEIGATGTFPGRIRTRNCNFNFVNASQGFDLGSGSNWDWDGGSVGGTTMPSQLFAWPSNTPPRKTDIRNVDFSAYTGTLMAGSIYSQFEMSNCRLGVGVTLPSQSNDANDNGCYFRMINCDDSTGATNYRYYEVRLNVVINSDIQCAAGSGATDGVTAYSHAYKPYEHGSNAQTFYWYADGTWMTRRWNTTGSSVTLTMEAVVFQTTIPTDLTMWMESETLETSGIPIGKSRTTRQKAPFPGGGTNVSASTKAWDAGATTRANSHAYALNSAFKVASNPGRIFRVTNSGGTSASSEPSGYASATDGSTFSDGTCTIVCGIRVKFQQTFTPQMAGSVRARINACFNTTNLIVYNVDPKLYIA